MTTHQGQRRKMEAGRKMLTKMNGSKGQGKKTNEKKANRKKAYCSPMRLKKQNKQEKIMGLNTFTAREAPKSQLTRAHGRKQNNSRI